MLLKNNSRRMVITVSKPSTIVKGKVEVGEKFRLKAAGPAVAVPDELCKGQMIRALIESGDVIVIPESLAAVDPLAELRAEAESLGIEVDKRWGEKRIQEEIARVKAAE
jgi:ABC-type proline/glycine betaine transport system ATPase subunit